MIKWKFDSVVISEDSMKIVKDSDQHIREMFNWSDNSYTIFLNYKKNMNVFFMDDERYEESDSIYDILKYYTDKVSYVEDSLIKLYIEENKIVEEKVESLNLKKKYIEEITKFNSYVYFDDKLSINPSIFHHIFKEEVSNYLTELLSMIIISNKMIINGNTIIFEFHDNEYLSLTEELIWKDTSIIKGSLTYYEALEWILNARDKEDLILRRKIVSNCILDIKKNTMNKSLHESNVKLLPNAKKTYDMVISNRTKDFFEMKEKELKSHLELMDHEEEAFNRLIRSVTTLIAILSSFFMLEVVSSDLKTVWNDLFNNKENLKVFMSIILIFVFILYVIYSFGVYRYKERLEKIEEHFKSTYGHDYENKKPKMSYLIKYIFILIIIILLDLIFFTL